MTDKKGLQSLVTELRQIDLAQPENDLFSQIKPILHKYITQPDDWFEDRFYEIDKEQGFGSHLIAENADHTLAVIITSWYGAELIH